MVRILILALILSSCSSTYHLNKAIKKEPTILQNMIVKDTIQISKIDSVPYIVNDTIHYKLIERFTDTIVEFKYKYINAPTTRHERRLKEQTERIELKYKFKLGKIIAEYDFKTAKLVARLNKRVKNVKVRQENKRSNWYLWLVIGLVIGFFSRFIKIF